MATIKVFDCVGVKQLNCFDTLFDVPYLEDEFIEDEEQIVEDKNPFE